MLSIPIPEQVQMIIRKLNEQGFEAYAVGGCVRDVLLGRTPEDWDITTSALPDQVKSIFGRTIDTGIRHGTVTVFVDHMGYEVTTYRIDGDYQDGRHPESVEFTRSLREDLKRRDFTINAMACSPRTGLVDEFGGIRDLKNKTVKCVGNPVDRFSEDALRMLRAIRFCAQLGFSMEEKTESAIRKIAPNLAKVSKERIQAELNKILLSGRPEDIGRVFETGLSPYVSEQFHSAGRGGAASLSALLPRKHLRWAGFLRLSSEQEAVRTMKELKMDNATVYRVSVLARMWKQEIPGDKTEIRRVMSRIPPELFDDLLTVQRAFCSECEAINPGIAPGAYGARLDAVAGLSREIRASGDCVSLKSLAVAGDDLIKAGMKPGKAVGAVLDRLLGLVLEHPEWNRKEILLKRAAGLPDFSGQR